MSSRRTSVRSDWVWQTLLEQWQPLLLIVLVGVLYAPVVVALVGDWYKDPDYSHGFFVPLLSAYIVYRIRFQLRSTPARPNWLGLIALLGSVALLFLGSLGAEYFLTRISLIGTIVALVLYFRGWTQLRILAFPLAFLLLMVPLPTLIYNQIVFPMQLVTSQLATGVLENMGLFPIMREGNLLITGRYTVEVVQACSGVRSLMSLLALALSYGYLAERSLAIRRILALSVVPLSIFGNALRVCTQVMLAYYFGVAVTEGLWHSLLGLIGFFSAAGLVPVLHEVALLVRRHFRSKKRVSLVIGV